MNPSNLEYYEELKEIYEATRFAKLNRFNRRREQPKKKVRMKLKRGDKQNA